MARPRTNTPADHGIFGMFTPAQLEMLSNEYYHLSYLEAIKSGRQLATQRFRRYWCDKLSKPEHELFKERTYDK